MSFCSLTKSKGITLKNVQIVCLHHNEYVFFWTFYVFGSLPVRFVPRPQGESTSNARQAQALLPLSSSSLSQGLPVSMMMFCGPFSSVTEPPAFISPVTTRSCQKMHWIRGRGTISTVVLPLVLFYMKYIKSILTAFSALVSMSRAYACKGNYKYLFAQNTHTHIYTHAHSHIHAAPDEQYTHIEYTHSCAFKHKAQWSGITTSLNVIQYLFPLACCSLPWEQSPHTWWCPRTGSVSLRIRSNKKKSEKVKTFITLKTVSYTHLTLPTMAVV